MNVGVCVSVDVSAPVDVAALVIGNATVSVADIVDAAPTFDPSAA